MIMFIYDLEKGELSFNGDIHKLYTGEDEVHPLIVDILKWKDGSKSLQELYTDILIWESYIKHHNFKFK